MIRLLILCGTFLLLGCMDADPGNAVNHVHIGKYIIDLTFGPIFSLFLAPLIIWGVKVVLVRLFNKWDASQKQALRIQEELDHERHQAIVGKLDSMCDRFDKVDRRFYNHGHVLAKNADGSLSTTDLTIRQTADGI